jgi:hypothetical protein
MHTDWSTFVPLELFECVEVFDCVTLQCDPELRLYSSAQDAIHALSDFGYLTQVTEQVFPGAVC